MRDLKYLIESFHELQINGSSMEKDDTYRNSAFVVIISMDIGGGKRKLISYNAYMI